MAQAEQVQPLIYIAGPLGFNEVGRSFLDSTCIPDLQAAGFRVLNPWNLTESTIIDQARAAPPGVHRYKAWRDANELIAHNNVRAIHSCDALVAFLDGSDIDGGTAAEIGFAYALHKPMVGYRSDFRFASDNEGCVVNLQIQYFVESTGGQIVSSWNEVMPALNRLLHIS